MTCPQNVLHVLILLNPETSNNYYTPENLCKTLQNYEEKYVIYNGRYIQSNDASIAVTKNKQTTLVGFEKLSNIKETYVELIFENLNEYIPTDLLEECDRLR